MWPTLKIYQKWNLVFVENIEKHEKFTVDKVKKKNMGMSYVLVTYQSPDTNLLKQAEQLRWKRFSNFNQIINSHFEDDRLYLQQELHSDFTLRDYLSSSKLMNQQINLESLSEALFVFLILAMLELHNFSLFLGALEPSEIFVSKLIEYNSETSFQSSDFKLRLPLHRISALGFSSGLSPESLTCRNPTVKSDVWSCGALLFKLLSGSNLMDPSREILQHQITSNFKTIQLKNKIFENLLEEMLKVNPAERLSPNSLVENLRIHKLIQENQIPRQTASRQVSPTSNRYQTPDEQSHHSESTKQTNISSPITDTFGVNHFQFQTQSQDPMPDTQIAAFQNQIPSNLRRFTSIQTVQGEGRVQLGLNQQAARQQRDKKGSLSKTPEKPIIQAPQKRDSWEQSLSPAPHSINSKKRDTPQLQNTQRIIPKQFQIRGQLQVTNNFMRSRNPHQLNNAHS